MDDVFVVVSVVVAVLMLMVLEVVVVDKVETVSTDVDVVEFAGGSANGSNTVRPSSFTF